MYVEPNMQIGKTEFGVSVRVDTDMRFLSRTIMLHRKGSLHCLRVCLRVRSVRVI
jgi:hypothetical protein